ncbi:MAG TPA: isocitrate lyase/phosphoenolpyruvate mutase family protein [Thermoleophilia bacterium]|nr:isocitrate lyase/phosphoenolpyruvate mutase family protein [Thermoleophilia bacterium]
MNEAQTPQQRAERFLALHHGPQPLLMPNAWDRGSARLLASLGFAALATTSSGFAATLGRLDGSVTRDEALAHAEAMAGATDVPVSADLEYGFADDPDDVAQTYELAARTGLAGCSIEDYAGRGRDGPYGIDLAAERVRAAAEAAHRGPVRLVLTARTENFVRQRPDLADTIARLQRYQEAGADVLFAPGVVDPQDLRQLVASVDLPVNVLALPGTPPVSELAEIGVRRVSVGGAFAWAAFAGLVDAATELRDHGTFGYLARTRDGSAAARAAFGTSS